MQVLIVAAAYAVAGKLSLALAIPPGYASALWPAAGIALAAVIVLGYRALPGIFLGSFLVNAWVSPHGDFFQSCVIAAAIGAGAVLQAALGGWLIGKFVSRPVTLLKERDIITFLVLGGPVSSIVSATVAIGSLGIARLIQPEALLYSWWTWWVGDTIGTLIFCPLTLLLFAEPRHLWKPRRLTTGLPLCITFVLVVGIYVRASHWESQRAGEQFEHQAQTLSQVLHNRIECDVELLRSVKSLFETSGQVSRTQFHDFLAAPLARHPELLAVSWNPLVIDADRRKFEEDAKREGLADFQITERGPDGSLTRASDRANYVPVYYIEPSQGNRHAAGFDTASDPSRSKSMKAAQDLGELIATDPLPLLQSLFHSDGFIVYGRVVGDDLHSDHQSNSGGKLRGFVAAVFQADQLISQSLAGLRREGVDLEIRDATAAPANRVIFRSANPSSGATGRADARSDEDLVYQTGFDVAGHRWEFRAVRPKEYLVAHPSWTTWMVLVRGLVFTSLLGGFLLVLTGRTARIEEEVAQRTLELSRSNDLLTREVRERAAAQEGLRQARIAAESANRAKSTFLANISHEIRTPLNAVIGFCDLLANPARSDISTSECIETIHRNSSHLLELLNDVLDFSRIEFGRMTVSRSPVDLMELVQEISQMMRPQAESKGLQFEFECAPDLPQLISSDRLRLRQILINLFGNAVKFTQQGGVQGRLWTSAVSSDGEIEVHFQVRDTGIGMTPQQIDGLFQAFTQADNSTTRQFGGTGLGLAISQRLAQLLDGGIVVESEPGRGSSFTLSIRTCVVLNQGSHQAMPQTLQARVQSPRPSLNGTVLVAEDARDNQRLIRALLETAGLNVHIARNGSEAIERARSHSFDLILMDVQMPVMDGWSATAAIRATNPKVPIIALTAHANVHDREKCLAMGCNDYLTKPIDARNLFSIVARYLAQANSSAAIRSSLADQPRWGRILDQYISELPEDVHRLSAALTQGNKSGLQRLVHQIKGSGGGHGFPEISRLAADAEEALARGELTAASPQIHQLMDYMRSVHGYIPAREVAAAAAA